jgi:iron(III) transport system ATP-binding protein
MASDGSAASARRSSRATTTASVSLPKGAAPAWQFLHHVDEDQQRRAPAQAERRSRAGAAARRGHGRRPACARSRRWTRHARIAGLHRLQRHRREAHQVGVQQAEHRAGDQCRARRLGPALLQPAHRQQDAHGDHRARHRIAQRQHARRRRAAAALRRRSKGQRQRQPVASSAAAPASGSWPRPIRQNAPAAGPNSALCASCHSIQPASHRQHEAQQHRQRAQQRQAAAAAPPRSGRAALGAVLRAAAAGGKAQRAAPRVRPSAAAPPPAAARRQLRRGDAVVHHQPGLVDAGAEGGQAEVGAHAVVGQRLHQRQRHVPAAWPAAPAAAPPPARAGAWARPAAAPLPSGCTRVRPGGAPAGRHRGTGTARTAAPRRPGCARRATAHRAGPAPGAAPPAAGCCTAAHRSRRRPARRPAWPAAAAAPIRRRAGPESRTASPPPPWPSPAASRPAPRRRPAGPTAARSRAARSAPGAQHLPARGIGHQPGRPARPAPAAPAAGTAPSARRACAGKGRMTPAHAEMRTILIHRDYHRAMFLSLEGVSPCATPGSSAARGGGATLGLRQGQIGVLIGPSGCGKTSLLRAVAGLERCDGRPHRMGGDAAQRRRAACTWRRARRIGMVFQDYALFPHLSVADNVAFGVPHLPARTRARVQQMLDLVGLGARRAARAAPALGRPAAAHGAGPRAGARSRAAAAGRALLQPGRRPARAPGAGGARHPEGQRHHGAVRHPRPARGLCAGRRDRRHAPGPPGAVGRRLHLYHRPASRFVAQFIGHGVFTPAQIERLRARRRACTRRWANWTTCRNARCPTPLPDGECDVLLRADDIVHDDASRCGVHRTQGLPRLGVPATRCAWPAASR